MAYSNKEDWLAWRRRWYRANKDAVIRRKNNWRVTLRQRLDEYKATLKCSRCSENHPATLDFHHMDPREKDRPVASVVRAGWSWARVLKEIEKCTVLCANCHRKEHFGLDNHQWNIRV